MDQNQIEQVKDIITTIIQDNLSPDAWIWLAEQRANRNQSAQQLNIAFASMPRKNRQICYSLHSAAS